MSILMKNSIDNNKALVASTSVDTHICSLFRSINLTYNKMSWLSAQSITVRKACMDVIISIQVRPADAIIAPSKPNRRYTRAMSQWMGNRLNYGDTAIFDSCYTTSKANSMYMDIKIYKPYPTIIVTKTPLSILL